MSHDRPSAAGNIDLHKLEIQPVTTVLTVARSTMFRNLYIYSSCVAKVTVTLEDTVRTPAPPQQTSLYFPHMILFVYFIVFNSQISLLSFSVKELICKIISKLG